MDAPAEGPEGPYKRPPWSRTPEATPGTPGGGGLRPTLPGGPGVKNALPNTVNPLRKEHPLTAPSLPPIDPHGTPACL